MISNQIVAHERDIPEAYFYDRFLAVLVDRISCGFERFVFPGLACHERVLTPSPAMKLHCQVKVYSQHLQSALLAM